MIGETEERDNIVIRCGKLMIDTRCHMVTLNGRIINLFPKEFELLSLLARHPGWVYTKEEIYEVVYGSQTFVDINNIIFCLIYGLRKKLEPNPQQPRYIQNVRGVGYKFVKDS